MRSRDARNNVCWQNFQGCSWRRRADWWRLPRSSCERPSCRGPITSCRSRRPRRWGKPIVAMRPRSGTDTLPAWGRTRPAAIRISARSYTWTASTSKPPRLTRRLSGCSQATRRPLRICTNWRRSWRDLKKPKATTRVEMSADEEKMTKRDEAREATVCIIGPRATRRIPSYRSYRVPRDPPPARSSYRYSFISLRRRWRARASFASTTRGRLVSPAMVYKE